MATFARTVLRGARESIWSGSRRSPPSRALMRRLQGLAQQAVRAREGDAVARLDALIAFAARGHTAGEDLRVGELLTLEDPVREKGIDPGSAGVDRSDLRVRIVGAILFVPE